MKAKDIVKKIEIIKYKGYTIEPEDEPWAIKFGNRFYFYPTKDGIQDDADYNGENFRYCGNRKWASSIEEAMEMIDDLITTP